MNSDNILSINVPNGVSIMVMILVGGLLLGMARKFVMGRMPQSSSAMAQNTVPGT